jgi:hypothetical protein
MMMMTTPPFQNLGRNDDIDTTQLNLDNTRYSNYVLSNFTQGTAEHVQFATSQPEISFNALTNGLGLNDDNTVDVDSVLNIQKTQGRSFEKVQLFQRPFVTVPFMGRGFGNPILESQLLQGEPTIQLKSVGTIMEKSFIPFSTLPVDSMMQERVRDPRYTVEEAALEGWTRGGMITRD